MRPRSRGVTCQAGGGGQLRTIVGPSGPDRGRPPPASFCVRGSAPKGPSADTTDPNPKSRDVSLVDAEGNDTADPVNRLQHPQEPEKSQHAPASRDSHTAARRGPAGRFAPSTGTFGPSNRPPKEHPPSVAPTSSGIEGRITRDEPCPYTTGLLDIICIIGGLHPGRRPGELSNEAGRGSADDLSGYSRTGWTTRPTKSPAASRRCSNAAR